MNLNFSNEISDRLKRLRSWFPGASPRRRHKVNALLKLNLPPLMGRRDAAYDCAVDQILSPIRPAADKAVSAKLLRTAVRDSEAIFGMLSNPDTELRERALLTHCLKLLNLARLLETFGEVGDQLNLDQTAEKNESLFKCDDKEFNRTAMELCDCEEKVVDAMRRLCERAKPRIIRYRGYATQNFSSPNAERYRKSYHSYMTIYSEENRNIDSITRPPATTAVHQF